LVFGLKLIAKKIVRTNVATETRQARMTQLLDQFKIWLVIFRKQLRQEIIRWLQIGSNEGLEMHLLIVWVV
jgi:hypothetical protein